MNLITFLIISFTALFANNIFTQEIDCKGDVHFVIDYSERNLPAYSLDINSLNRNEYESFKKEIINKSVIVKSQKECFQLLYSYVEFFKDQHSTIATTTQTKDWKNYLKSNEYLNRETIINLKKKQYKIDDLRGTYISNDTTYELEIIKVKNQLYKGVVTNSNHQLLKNGDVLLDIELKSKNTCNLYINFKDFYLEDQIFSNGYIGSFFWKKGLKQHNNSIDNELLKYLKINDSTNYIKIKSFDGSLIHKIDSFYQKHFFEISNKKYLIIDLRDNGGGNDAAANKLLEYMYTKSFFDDNVSYYVTKDNISKYEKILKDWKKDSINYSRENVDFLKVQIERMKQVPINTFLPMSLENNKIELDTILPFPSKIAVISNKNCASSCETVLFWAKQSDKTIIVGDNSAGYVGFGDVEGIETPNFKFKLNLTKTVYPNQRKFEKIGIPPNYYLEKNTDWLNQTLQILYQKNK